MGPDGFSPPTMKRRRLVPAWAWATGAVILLATVIGVGAALSAPKRSEPATTEDVVAELGPADQAAGLIDEAREAAASGDTTKALGLLEDALAVDPGNSQASGLKDQLSEDDADPSEQATGQPAPSNDPFLKAIPVAKLIPAMLQGYSAGIPVSDGKDAVLTADPAPSTRQDDMVAHAQMSVHDRGSASEATAYTANVTKKLYKVDVTSANVHGAPAYVGTDGGRLAAVVYVRGRYVFEVVLTAEQGSPAGIRTLAVELAKQFPSNAP